MDRLSLKNKFLLIVSLCVLPISILGYINIVNANQRISFYEKEQQGMPVIVQLKSIMVDVGRSRGLTNSYLFTVAGVDKTVVMQARKSVEDGFSKLDVLEKEAKASVPLSNRLSEIRRAWGLSGDALVEGSVDKSFSAYSEVVSLIIEYLNHVGHVSNLLQEPDINTAYLIDAIIRRLPSLAENIGQIRGIGSAALADPLLLASSQKKLAVLLDRVNFQNEMFETRFEYVIDELSILEGTIKDNEAIDRFIELTNSRLLSVTKEGLSEISPQGYFSLGSEAIDHTLRLFDEMVPMVNESISTNIDQHIQDKRISLLMIFGVIFLLIYLLSGFYVSFSSRLRELLINAEHMAAGDLTEKIDVRSNDEMGQIAKAMDKVSRGVSQTVLSVIRTSNLFTDVSTRLSESSQLTENSVTSQVEDSIATSQSIAELSATVQDVSNNISEAARSAQKAEEASDKGQQAVVKVVESIDVLAVDLGRASEVISKLNDDSQKISSILLLINEIADQTNLLALNAAIEAARAGEQGRGFAVVADEVRNLAQKTQNSTLEIQGMVEELKSGSQSAVDVMHTSEQKLADSVEQARAAGDVLSEITTLVSSISEMNSRIAVSAEHQSNMAKTLDNNVLNMTSAASQSSAVAKSTVEDGAIVKALASEAQSLINRFVVDKKRIDANNKIDILFVWDESFSVGLPEIDRQHQILIGMINELNRHVKLKDNMFFVQRVLQGLIDYTVSHFSYEEGLLERNEYEDLVRHKEKHKKLIAQVLAFQPRLESEGEAVLEELLNFLNDWLAKHIKGSDKEYGRVLLEKEAKRPTDDVAPVDEGELELF